MNNTPKFTVIITTYNAQKFLARAIESVLNQTYQDFELIVANDGSPDQSPAITKEYMKRSSKIIFLDCPHSGGPAAPTNSALKIAKGEYLSFLEYDDEWDKTKLEKMLALFEKYPDTGYAGSNVKIVDDNTGKITYYNFKPEDMQQEVRKFKAMTGEFFTNWSNIVIKREALLDIGFLDERILIGPDYDYFLRMGQKYPFRYIDEVLMTYHVHTTNISIGSPVKNGKLLSDQEVFLAKHADLYSKYPRIYANRIKDVAEWNIKAGSMKRAILLLLRSIKTYPLEFKTYPKLLLALFGRKIYLALRKI